MLESILKGITYFVVIIVLIFSMLIPFIGPWFWGQILSDYFLTRKSEEAKAGFVILLTVIHSLLFWRFIL